VIIADPNLIDTECGRISLYRVFTRTYNSAENLPRQAFLFHALEGFTEADGAQILEVDVCRFQELVKESSRELEAEHATDVLIIEGDPLVSSLLEDRVIGLGHRIIGIARTHGEAVDLASRQEAGLILADIKLADGSDGLEAVRTNSLSANSSVTTASAEL
jgi:hypothetical protein